MNAAGLDVGSRTIALVLLGEEEPESVVVDTGARPRERCLQLLAESEWERLVVTGYGRHHVAPTLAGEVVSEITAHAIGARHLYPDCRTVIDVGGQDTKAIALSENGSVRRFEMNDRCAAGTGRFLEVMADTLESSIEQLGGLALSAVEPVLINSLCTVFAESEVVSLIARGAESSAVALGLHEAIATRIVGMARRIGPEERTVFAGGAALNPCLRHLLQKRLGTQLTVPDEPQSVGALGAALLARRRQAEVRA